MATWVPKPPESEEFFTMDLVRQLGEGDRVEECACAIEVIKGDRFPRGGPARAAALAGSPPGPPGRSDPLSPPLARAPCALHDASSMLRGGVEINGTAVTQKVGGGVPRTRYRLTFTARTLFGETLTPSGDFWVGTTEPGPRDLTTLRDVKDWLGITKADSDALLQRLITAESAAIESHLGRPVLLEERTDVVQGYGSSMFVPPATPVRSVARVTIDGAPVPVGHDGLRVWRQDGGSWPRGSRIEIAYTAGLDEVPYDIAQACVELVAYRYRERDRIGHASKSIAGETISFITSAMPAAVSARLAPYRKVAPV